MDCYRLLYVSRSLIADCHTRGAIARILMASYRNNSRQGVSGALMYSGEHFVQILEGEKRVVETLLDRIAADWLHCDLDVVAARHASSRMFKLWTMAYCGATNRVQSYIARLVQERDAANVARLEHLMRRLVDVGGIGTDDEAFEAVARAGRRSLADDAALLPIRPAQPLAMH